MVPSSIVSSLVLWGGFLAFAMIAALMVGIVAAPAAASGPTGPVVYSAIPASQPGNVPSLGYQANQTAEFGDLVTLASTATPLAKARVVLSSWACQTGGGATCATTPGATFSHPLTFNVYAVDNSGPVAEPGALLATKTQTFAIPYRPSADPPAAHGCTGGAWYSTAESACYNGLATEVEFDMPAVTLPSQVIWTVAFNTQSYGSTPLGTNGPYNSLNVGLQGTTHVGTDVDPDGVMWNTSTLANYTDPSRGSGILRDDSGWAPFVPEGELELAPPTPTLTLTPLPTTSQFGDFEGASVTISGGNSPTGLLTTTLYSASANPCVDGGEASSTSTVYAGTTTYTGDTYQINNEFAGVGTWYLQSVYSGDAGNSPSTSACVPITVTKGGSTTTLQALPRVGAGPLLAHASVNDLNVGGVHTGAIDGPVTFGLYTNAACTTPAVGYTPEVANLDLTDPIDPMIDTPAGFTPPAPGTYYWNATFGGNSVYNGSSSLCTPAGVIATLEGSGSNHVVNVPVALSAPVGTTVTVSYATSDGPGPHPATAGDYLPTSGSVSFAPGETTKNIPVTVVGNLTPQLDEYDETFTVTVSNPVGATLGTPTTTVVTIVNDDTPQIRLSAAAVPTVEGNSGTHTVTLTATMSNPSLKTYSVGYTTADGTAKVGGKDYVAATGTLTFLPGQLSKTFTVTVKGDTTLEDFEYFSVVLSAPTGGATLGNATESVEIQNDETPTLTFANVSVSEGQNVVFLPKLVQRYYQNIVVSYTTANGTAIAPGDYASATGNLTFTAGTKGPQAVSVPTVHDFLTEVAETFNFTVTGPLKLSPVTHIGAIKANKT
jgi:Calx-beta domain.